MNLADKHLSDEQIDWLVAEKPGELEWSGSQESLDEARRHLAACEKCQKTVQAHLAFERDLQDLRMRTPEEERSDCPSTEALYEVAAGLQSPESEKVIDHAAQCKHCGPILRQAAEVVGVELTPEEESVLDQLQSATPVFQEKLAKRLASQSAPSAAVKVPVPRSASLRLRPFVGFRRFYAATAVAAAVALTWFGLHSWYSSAAYVNGLVAKSYVQQRTIEMRISGAPYAPLSVERGAGNSNISRPGALLEAELVIGENLRKHPSDPEWLRAKARADLMDGNFDSAVQALQKAIEIQPKSAELLTELGSAHFERAEAFSNGIEYGTAIEFLSLGLRAAPDDPVALFNRAVALERAKLYEQATEDWEHYLRIDARGAWADDARRRLDALRMKIKKQAEASSELLYQPAELVKLAAVDRRSVRAAVDQRIEEYLSQIVREWFRNAVVKEDPRGAADVLGAAGIVAEIAEQEHGDRWLSDFLSKAHGGSFASGVDALSKAARANDQAAYDSARSEAEAAKQLFERSGNLAGALRAELELAYAYHFSRDATMCLNAVRTADDDSRKNGYRWLSVQFKLEKSICVGLTGNLGDSVRLADQALGEAKNARYENVYLRAVGLSADLSAEIGDVTGAWDKASAGLDQFWSGTHSPMAGYNLYTDLDTVADIVGQRNLEIAIEKQGLKLIESDPDLLLRAMAHRWMADAAYSGGIPDIAEKEFAEAGRLFAAAPQTEATRNDRVEAEIWLARLEIKRGDVRRAEALLRTIEQSPGSVANNFVAERFYEAESELELLRNDLQRAERFAREAVALAESSLWSLHSETDRLAWRRDSSDAYRSLVELRIRQGDMSGALEEWEWFRGAVQRSLADRRDDERDVPGRVKKTLPTLTTASVLSIALLHGGIATWMYDDRGVTGTWKNVAPANVVDLARQFRQLCSDPHSDLETSRDVGRKVYDLLVAPSATRLRQERELVIELDDELASLPLEASVDSNGRYLGETTTVVFSPGLYVQESLGENSRLSRGSSAVVIAVPSGAGPQMLPLPDVIEEARMVASHFSRGELFVGGSSKEIDLEHRLAGTEIFHFAGHSVLAGNRSGLVLGGTTSNGLELFDAGSFETKRFPQLKLVVLSACSSAVGTGGHPDDADALLREFLRLGVPHVVGSRWNIDSATTSRFMSVFYTKLLEAKSIPAAMQGTEADFRSRNETLHPYYWSAFGVFGRQ